MECRLFHYIYKITDIGGKYYIGRHSTYNLDDGYMGSGIWVKRHTNKHLLTKTILEHCDSFEDLVKREGILIRTHINDPQNMNFNDSPIGAATGLLNISHRIDVKRKHIQHLLTNNHMKNGHKEETKQKIRNAMLGEKNPFYGKTHSNETKEKIRNKNTGKRWNQEQRTNLSNIRKKQFGGERPPKLFCESHSEETKEKMRQSALNRQKICCPFCKAMCAPHVAKRWHFDNCKHKEKRL